MLWCIQGIDISTKFNNSSVITVSSMLKFIIKQFNVIRNLNIKFLFYDLYCIIMLVKVMDNPIEFKSAKELYDRVLPALYSKVKEVRNLGFKYITEKDIWNYLVNNTWKTKKNLQLHDLISDILYADNYKLNDYVMDKMKKLKIRNDNVDEEML